jgi:hypothetical protein
MQASNRLTKNLGASVVSFDSVRSQVGHTRQRA